MDKGYLIGPAGPQDSAVLVTLSRSVIDSCFRAFMGDAAVDGYIGSGMADREITDHLADTSVLLCDNRIIGLCVWKEDLLHVMMVSPGFHGTGAARYFLDAMCEEKFKTFPVLRLECFEDNKRANAFCMKGGWVVVRYEKDTETG